jgi:hypothetical protein
VRKPWQLVREVGRAQDGESQEVVKEEEEEVVVKVVGFLRWRIPWPEWDGDDLVQQQQRRRRGDRRSSKKMEKRRRKMEKRRKRSRRKKEGLRRWIPCGGDKKCSL